MPAGLGLHSEHLIDLVRDVTWCEQARTFLWQECGVCRCRDFKTRADKADGGLHSGRGRAGATPTASLLGLEEVSSPGLTHTHTHIYSGVVSFFFFFWYNVSQVTSYHLKRRNSHGIFSQDPYHRLRKAEPPSYICLRIQEVLMPLFHTWNHLAPRAARNFRYLLLSGVVTNIYSLLPTFYSYDLSISYTEWEH